MSEHTRRALLIGNASYPAEDRLLDLKCPLNDVEGLKSVLADPDIGAFDPVDTLCDCDSIQVKRKLITFLADARSTDTVLIYYSGHGKLDGSYQLNFCTRDSEVDVLEATAVPVAFIRDQLSRCNAQNTVLMLDCCYSGAAKGILSRGDVDDQLKLSVKGSGTYLLTASNAMETAQEKEGDRYGVFTKHLIEALETGDADKDGNGVTTMDDLYHYIVNAVRSDSPQRPTRQVDGHGRIIVAKSGKNSRLDTATKLSSELFTQVANGYLDASIATAAVDIARKSPSTLTPGESTFDNAITDYLAKRISLGEFVTAYWNTRLEPGPGAGTDRETAQKAEHTANRETEQKTGQNSDRNSDRNSEGRSDRNSNQNSERNPDQTSEQKSEPSSGHATDKKAEKTSEQQRIPPTEPQSDFDRIMRLLLGKLWIAKLWKTDSASQPFLGSQGTRNEAQLPQFKWLIPLSIFIGIAGVGESAVDPDTLVGGGFLGIVVMVFYLTRYRSRLNLFGWIISLMALLAGVGVMVDGLSY